jgi:hypothetical protein
LKTLGKKPRLVASAKNPVVATVLLGRGRGSGKLEEESWETKEMDQEGTRSSDHLGFGRGEGKCAR